MIQPENLLKISNLGTVDSGKSTILGQLLYSLNPKIKKTEKWCQITDCLQIEHKQNITKSIAHQYCQLDKYRLHFFDDPGHLEYINQTISGLIESDIVIYVIDPFSPDISTIKFHSYLMKWLGIRDPIYLLNKCDQLTWNKHKIESAIKYYKSHQLHFNNILPVCGKSGDNIVYLKNEFTPSTLLQTLEDKIKFQHQRIKNKFTHSDSYLSISLFVWDFNFKRELSSLYFLQIDNKKYDVTTLHIDRTFNVKKNCFYLYRGGALSSYNFENKWGVLVKKHTYTISGIFKFI